jgi:hypothetical protein
MVRGGFRNNNPWSLRGANCVDLSLDNRDNSIGFRIARTVAP